MKDLASVLAAVEINILKINNTNNMIFTSFINRKSGITGLAENIKNFIIRSIYRHKSYINSRDHNILGKRFLKIKNVV